jgi:septal ring factor EnvC (AmiA/AmiB activator)
MYYTISEIINFLSLNIQIIGVFIAIIGGLVATKILSLNAEKDELRAKINSCDKEIKYINKTLNQNKKLNERIYQEDILCEIMDSIIERREEFDLMEYQNPYISREMRENFYNHVISVVLEGLKSIRENKESLEEVSKTLNVKKGTIDYKILEDLYERVGQV